MRKYRFLVYILLLAFLGFIALKANKSLDFSKKTKVNTKMSIQHTILSENVQSSAVSKLTQQPEAKAVAKTIDGEFFATYSITTKDGTINKNIYKTKKGNKYGLIDENNQTLVKAVYDNFAIFDEKEGIYISIRNGKRGLVNYKGRMLIPTKYEYFTKTLNSDYVIINNSKYSGVYDLKRAKMVIPAIYTSVQALDDSNWKVTSGKKIGFLHCKNGREDLIKPKYHSLEDYKMVYKTTSLSGKLGLIDKKSGQIISEPLYDEIELINEQNHKKDNILIFRTRIDNRYGVIYFSIDSSTIISPIYDEVQYKGLVNVFSNGYWRILDNKGNVVSRTQGAFK